MEFDKNLEWFKSNYKNIKETHSGEYILIVNQDVLASSVSSSELINKIKEEGHIGYYLTYVPEPDETIML